MKIGDGSTPPFLFCCRSGISPTAVEIYAGTTQIADDATDNVLVNRGCARVFHRADYASWMDNSGPCLVRKRSFADFTRKKNGYPSTTRDNNGAWIVSLPSFTNTTTKGDFGNGSHD